MIIQIYRNKKDKKFYMSVSDRVMDIIPETDVGIVISPEGVERHMLKEIFEGEVLPKKYEIQPEDIYPLLGAHKHQRYLKAIKHIKEKNGTS